MTAEVEILARGIRQNDKDRRRAVVDFPPAAKRVDIDLDKHPGTLLELFQDSSNIQAGYAPDTIADGLSR